MVHVGAYLRHYEKCEQELERGDPRQCVVTDGGSEQSPNSGFHPLIRDTSTRRLDQAVTDWAQPR